MQRYSLSSALFRILQCVCIGGIFTLLSCGGESVSSSSVPSSSSTNTSSSSASILSSRSAASSASDSSAAISSSSSSSSSISSSSSSSSNEVLVGRSEYEAMCANCHGVDGAGGFGGPVNNGQCKKTDCRNTSVLAEYIALNMPLGGTDSCIGDCARDIAGYIVDVFNSIAQVGDADGDGILDSQDKCAETQPVDYPSINHEGCPTHSGYDLVTAINAASSAYQSMNGVSFIADDVSFHTASNIGGQNSTQEVLGTDDDPVYRTERYATPGSAGFDYKVVVEPGVYKVSLMFTEVFHNAAGLRSFDVVVEGQTVASALDIFAAAGGRWTAYDVEKEGILVSDGELNINFISRVNNATVSGIKVYRRSANDGDNDGVLDEADACWGSMPGVTVSLEGCTAAQLDKDNDGVALPQDKCPKTPADQISSVAMEGLLLGCSEAERLVDTDRDGVSDVIDKCLDSNSEFPVGVNGCSGVKSLASGQIISPQVRLLKREYENTIKVAFDVSDLPGIVLPNDSKINAVFADNAGDLSSFLPYLEAAEQYGEHFAPSLANRCDWAMQPSQCITREFQPIAEVLYRSSLSQGDIGSLTQIMTSLLAEGSTLEETLASVIARVLIDTRFLFRIEVGGDQLAERVKRLSEDELKIRLAYLLTDNPPGESTWMASNLFDTPNGVRAHAEELMASPEFQNVAWQFISEWLGIPSEPPGNTQTVEIEPLMGDQCNLTLQCRDHFVGLAQTYDCVNSQLATSWCSCDGQACNSLIPESTGMSLEASMYEETRRFVDYVVGQSNAPFSELFTANYSFINKTLAEHYGVPAPAVDWQRVDFPPNAKRRGILTHASFLSSTSDHKRDVLWIYRGKTLYERFFCEHLPAPPANAADIEVESRETTAPCMNCHTLVDPIGRIFDNYDDHGRLTSETRGDGQITIGVDIDGDYPDPLAFAEVIGESNAVAQCLTSMWYQFALARKPYVAESDSFEQVRNTFIGSNSLSEMIKTFVVTESFTTVHYDNTDELCARP